MHNCMSSVFVEKSNFFYKNIEYIKTECSHCGYTKTVPFIVNDSVDVYESGHYKVKNYTLLPLLINFFDYIYFYLIFLNNNITNKSYVLDFGSGKGFFLYFLKLFKFINLFGLETSTSRADFSKKLTGLNISKNYYSKGTIHNLKFDCISLIHVLEHIPNPFNLINKLTNDALRDNGFLFIEVPNINSLSSVLAGKTWAHFTPHFHTNHFSSECLKNYCLQNNLKYKLISTFSFYNSSMGMTSTFLSFFGYRGSIFEDIKMKKINIILFFLFFLPFSIPLEFFLSFFFNRGSVLKCYIYKN